MSAHAVHFPEHRVIRQLPRGSGHIQTFLAEDIEGRKCVIKTPDRGLELDSAARDRFLKSYRTMAQVASPAVCRVFALGERDPPFVALEYLGAGSLIERLAQGVDLRQALVWTLRLAEGLAAVHGAGALHRDLKPSAVLFRGRDLPVLTDFAVRRRLSLGAVAIEDIGGLSQADPNYASPELITGENVDARADIYSLAAVLFHLLDGSPPFAAERPLETITRHLNDPIPKLKDSKSCAQPLVDRGLAKDPEQRFRNAEEFVEALGEVLRQVVAAEPASIPKVDESIPPHSDGSTCDFCSIFAPRSLRHADVGLVQVTSHPAAQAEAAATNARAMDPRAVLRFTRQLRAPLKSDETLRVDLSTERLLIGPSTLTVVGGCCADYRQAVIRSAGPRSRERAIIRCEVFRGDELEFDIRFLVRLIEDQVANQAPGVTSPSGDVSYVTGEFGLGPVTIMGSKAAILAGMAANRAPVSTADARQKNTTLLSTGQFKPAVAAGASNPSVVRSDSDNKSAADLPVLAGYQLEQLIGRGGSAEVYRGIAPNGERVAIKRIKLDQLVSDGADTSFWAERHAQEIRFLSRCAHPGIVRVFNHLHTDEATFLIMELLEGGSLLERVRKGPMTMPETVAITVQLAAALGYLHDRGVIHRDIKSGNVLFRNDGSAVIIDLGIAKYQKHSEPSRSWTTQTGNILGTPLYMSPEILSGKIVDARSDLYQLGIVVFEMLMGRLPFDGDTPIAVAMKHMSETPPPLPDALAPIQQVLDRLLAKAPTDRYHDAGELIKALDGLPAQCKPAH